MKIKVKIKSMPGLVIPKNAHDSDAGYDIIATSEPNFVGEKSGLNSWKRLDYIEYQTNIFIQPVFEVDKEFYWLNNYFHTLIMARSSISSKNLVLCNSVGLADASYTGQLLCRFQYIWQPYDLRICPLGSIEGVIDTNKIYQKNQKIAQLVFQPTIHADFIEVEELEETERGENGFGSSDKKV